MNTEEKLAAENEALRQENLEMRRRVDALEREAEEQRRRVAPLQASELMLQAFLDHTPALMYVKDSEGRLLLTNKEHDRLFRRTEEGMVGSTDRENYPAEVAEELRAFDRAVLAAGHVMRKEEVIPHPEGVRHYLTIKFPISNVAGAEGVLGGVSVDISALKQAEAARAEAQAAIIEAQEATIRELAAPLLPIAEDALLLPIVGAIDAERAQRMLEDLLRGITENGADMAILDITGVRSVDAHAANALVRAAHGARLLGATAVLTGIQPSIARTLVEMGVDLGELATKGTLQEGIAYAFERRAARARTKASAASR